MKRFRFLAALPLVLAATAFATACGDDESPPEATPTARVTTTPPATAAPAPTPEVSPTPTPTPAPTPVVFDLEELKSAHYLQASVAHGAKLPAPPAEVSINFNFVLAPPTQFRVEKDGATIATSTTISADRLTLSGAVPDSGPGVYAVYYDACWPDGSCHQGQFGFVVE